MLAASEHPASRSGISTVRSGARMAAVSAMKCTPAEHDHVGVGGGRLLRQAQRVADVVGHVLHLGDLVVVGQDHGVSLACQRAHLVLHGLDIGCGQDADGGTSSAMSSARTECVERSHRDRVDAGLGHLADGVDGDAAGRLQACAAGRRCHRPAQLARAACCRAGSRRRRRRAPAAAGRACRPRPRPVARDGAGGRARPRPATPPATRHVVVLDQHGVVQARRGGWCRRRRQRRACPARAGRAPSCACPAAARRSRPPGRRSAAWSWRCRTSAAAG